MLHVFAPQGREWKTLAEATQEKVRTVKMLPIGNELISINTSDNIKFTVESLQPYVDSVWIKIGELSMLNMEITYVTNVGSKLIIFWKQAHGSCITIVCFDLIRLQPYIVPHQLDICDGLVAFKHADEAFVLQQSVSLWRMSAQAEAPVITLKREMELWISQRVVYGALLFEKNLLVFVDKSSDESLLRDDACLDKVFSGVQTLQVSSAAKGFVHAVVHKSLISKDMVLSFD
ncbi:neuronal acetylcholine receptor subunit alpha-3 [Plakobranchus ocellatus]|uniref:Neuronal acetylcholine receptor subunit alpha-3 n=1 Tax=Plakobranchus ocellatus TaxID=259542 RepID=A0AAV3YLX4_9GAST|nr:neuronal acetylcholine receptor subunit alpha-3 [Plakobranchus ocellatus]